tara:strand:+ start:238 stop:495 length:258 start_codon:yes stop_codon:yes gene_type:complete
MTPTLVLALVALVSAVSTAMIPLWRNRKASPDSMAVVLTGSAAYLAEVHQRLAELEARVHQLETENRAYFNLHGPPPGVNHEQRG